MRVNIEDDLFLSGRLTAFAKTMGVDEDTALGRLALVWRETQHRELVTVSMDEFRQATFVRLIDPQATLLAMVAAGLATKTGNDRWLIHGNEVHAERLGVYRQRAQKGGIARQRANKKPATSQQAEPSSLKQPATSQQRARSQLERALLAPSSLLQKQEPDLKPDPNLPVTIKKSDLPRLHRGVTPGAQQPTGASAIRLTYLNAYARKFARPFVGWGARENGQCKNLLGSWPLHRVLELIPLYFDWSNPVAIRAGYPFGFFVSSIHELDTDTHAPERKRLAAAAAANERQVGNDDAEKIRTESNLNSFVDKFAREVTDAERQAKTSVAGRKGQEDPAKRFLSLSGGAP